MNSSTHFTASRRPLFAAALTLLGLLGSRSARAESWGWDVLDLKGGGYDCRFSQKTNTSSFIWYQVIRQTNPTNTGNQWCKFIDNGSWCKQWGFYGGGTLTPNNNAAISGSVDAGGDAGSSACWESWGAPSDITINWENGKSYAINVFNDANIIGGPGNDVCAMAVVEINHQSTLVQPGTPADSNSAALCYLSFDNANAENAGSCEEIWFQWTTNNFSTKNFVEITNIAAKTTLNLIMTNQVNVGANVRWLAMTTADSTTSEVSSTTSGAVNFDGIAIYKVPLRSYWVKPPYRADAIVDEFMYDDGQALDWTKNGGYGFTNAYHDYSGNITISAGNLTAATNYPTPLGNKAKGDPGANSWCGANRDFPSFTTGTFYLAWIMNVGNPGAERYAGIDVRDLNGTTLFMVGLPGDRTNLAIQKTSGYVTSDSTYGITGGQDYTIISKYDFSTHTLSIIGYYINTTIPLNEPTSWTASQDLGSGYVTNISRIQLTGGGWTATYDIGDVYWDEIRIAKTWKELLNQIQPVWDGKANNANWSNPTNWVGDVVPSSDTNVTFYDTIYSGTNINVDSAVTVLGLRFSDLADTALNITNSAITINGGGIAISNGAAGNHVIAAPIVVNANQSWTNESSTADITLSGVISGSGSITKMGNTDGRFILSGNNTFTNTVTVTQGKAIVIANANALGSTAAGTTVNSGPSLQILGGITTAAEPLTLNGDGYWGGGALWNVSGNNTFAGPITLGSKTRINSSSGSLTLNSATTMAGSYDLEISGSGDVYIGSVVGTGSGNIRKVNPGELRLSGANTYTGKTCVSGGVVRVNNDGSLGSAPGAAVVDSITLGATSLAIGTAGQLTTTNGSSWTLNANRGITINDAGGTISNIGGTVTFNGIVTGNGPFTKAGSGDLVFGGANTYTGSTTIVGSGALRISADNGLGTAPGSATPGQLTFNGGQLTINGAMALAANRGIAMTGAGTIQVSANASYGGIIAGSGALTKSGASTLTISGSSTHSGSTTISAGRWIQNGTNSSSAFTVGGGTYLNGIGAVGGCTVSGELDAGTNGTSVGNLAVSSLTLNALGTNHVHFTNVTGTAGTGWDLITVGSGSGTVTINSSAGNEFVLMLDTKGTTPANWNNANSYNWTVMDAGTLSTFAGSKFTINTSLWAAATAGGTFSLSESSGDLVVTFTPSLSVDIQVRGTNMSLIANSNAAPAEAIGTDYGNIPVVGTTHAHTFTITNSGAAAIGYGPIYTNGVNTNFYVTTQPSGSPLAAGGTTTFVVTFDPSSVGTTNCVIAFTNTVAGKNIYSFTIQGTGTWAGINVQPSTFTTNTLWGTPGNFAFGVTNCGNGTLSYTVTTNYSTGASGWASNDVGSASLGQGAGQAHTVKFNTTGMSAGTYYATNTFTDANASNSPKTLVITMLVTNMADPTSISAWGDGREMVRLGWTKDVSYDVMITYRATNAPTDPTQGTTYTNNQQIGTDGTRVIYTGTLASLEHVVVNGLTHHYKFYSMTNSHYSSGYLTNVVLSSYPAGIIADAIAYTNSLAMDTAALNNGVGFTNAWVALGSGFTIASNDIGSRPTFTNMPSYPSRGGNRIKLADPGNNSSREAYRLFNRITNGTVYMAGMMSYGNTGSNRWCGFSIITGNTPVVFFGRAWSVNSNGFFGMTDYGSSASATNPMSSWGAALSNSYLVIAKYTFTNRVLQGNCIPGWQWVSPAEPTVWPAQDTVPAGTLPFIDGMGVKAGCSAAGQSIGECYFDELWVSTNWSTLFPGSVPGITNYAVNTSNYVSDAMITSGVFGTSATFYDPVGIGTNADFDLWNSSGIQILTNEDTLLACKTWYDSGRTMVATDAAHVGYYPGDLGVYTTRWSAANSNGYWIYDNSTLSNGTPMTFTVFDDDTNYPNAGNSLMLDPGVEIGPGDGSTPSRWWIYGSCGQYSWAPRSGTNGVAWQSWSSNAWGGFGQDIFCNLSTQSVVLFTMWGKAETGFSSMVGEAWIKMEFYSNGTKRAEASNSVYAALTASPNVWSLYSVGYTNTMANINQIKVTVGSGNWWGGGGSGRSVTWDDAAFSVGTPLQMWIGTTNFTGSDRSTNATFTLYDSQLASVTTATPWRLMFEAWDDGSGLNRGNNANTTNMNIDIGSWVTDNASNYYAAESSVSTLLSDSTNEWMFTNALGAAAIDSLVNTATNLITVSLFDADSDRSGDNLIRTNHQYGKLVALDDDTAAPFAGNVLQNPGFEIGSDGVWEQTWHWYWGNPDTLGSYWGNVDVRSLSSWRTHSGTNEAAIHNWSSSAADSGFYQTVTNSAGAGVTWYASAWFWNDNGGGGGTYTNVGQSVAIEFYSAAGACVGGNTNTFARPGETWTLQSIMATSPANAVWARFVVSAWGQGQSGALQVDDACLMPAPAMRIRVGSSYLPQSDYSTNAVFYIDYAALTNVSASTPFYMWFTASDPDSGLSRGTTDKTIQMNVDFGSVCTDDVAHFVLTNSTPDASTKLTTATNAWVWYGFSASEVLALTNGTNRITVSVFDADADRTSDRLLVTNQQYGFLVVTAAPPSVGAIIYDGFTASSGDLNGGSGGTGWSNSWSESSTYADYASGSFSTGITSFACTSVNKVVFWCDVDGRQLSADRTFAYPITAGKVYVSWMQNYAYNGLNKWAGLTLLDGTTAKAFIGKVSGGDQALGIDSSSDNRVSATNMANGVGNDYVVAAMYDFSTRELSATFYKIAFGTNGEMIAEQPDGYWYVTTTQTVGYITRISGVRLGAGSQAGAQIGAVYFDEVRVWTNWFGVNRAGGETNSAVMANGPSPTLLFVGTNYNPASPPANNTTITDAQLTNNIDKLDFAVLWTNTYGTFLTNRNGRFNIGSRSGRVVPNWDPLTKAGSGATNFLNMDTNFTGFLGYNGAPAVTSYVQNAFSISNSTVGDTYYISVSAENNNTNSGTIDAPNTNDAVPVLRALTVNSQLVFTVADDDPTPPALAVPALEMSMGATNIGNLLNDPGFDSAGGVWTLYSLDSCKITNSAGENGGGGILFKQTITTCGIGNTNDFGGFFQDYTIRENVSRRYLMSVRGRDGSSHFDCSQVALKFEFYDSGTTLLYATETNVLYLLTNYWRTFSYSATSPASASKVRVSVHFDTATSCVGTDGRTSMWDNVKLYWATLSETNPILRVTDGNLASVNASSPLHIQINGYDVDSGLERGITDAATQTFISVANLVTNNVSKYDASSSAAATTSPDSSSNIWTWGAVTNIDNFMSAGSNVVVTTLRDGDNDRIGDRLSLSNATAGLFVVFDDDTNGPARGYMKTQNYLANPGFETNGAQWILAPGAPYCDFTADSAETGSYGLMITNYAPFGWATLAYQFQDVIPNQTYVLSVRAKKVGSPSLLDFYLKAEHWGVGGSLGTWSETNFEASLTTNWQTFTRTFVQPANALSNKIVLMYYQGTGADGGGAVFFDNASFSMSIGPPIDVKVGNTAIEGSDDTTNALYDITDAQMAGVTNTNALRIIVAAYDTDSGLARTNQAGTADSNTTLTVVNLTTNNMTNFVSSESSPTTVTSSDTNSWRWDSVPMTAIQSLFGAGSNVIQVTMKDADRDRTSDQLSVSNQVLGYLRVIDDDTGYPQQGATPYNSPIVVGVDNYYANLIDDWFPGTNLNRQWGWEAEPGSQGALNNGCYLYATSSYAQVAFGSIHSYPWANRVAYTYQFTMAQMFTNLNYQVQMFLVGDYCGPQPYGYSDYQNPNVIYLCVKNFGTLPSPNWGVKLLIKTNQANVTAYGAGAQTLAETYSLPYVTNVTFGFKLNNTNILLFATNAAMYYSVTTNMTAAQMAYFSSNAYVHVGARNDNASPIGGDICLVTNVRVMPDSFSTNTCYELNDGDLAYVSTNNPLKLMFPSYDTNSGLARGITDSTTQMNVTVVNLVTNNVTNYWATESSADTTVPTATSIWRFTSFDGNRIQSMMNGVSNKISATMFDQDYDRPNDQLIVSNAQYGFLRITDDDTAAPSFGYNTNWFQVLVGGRTTVVVSGYGTTNVVYQVTDGQLADAAVSNVQLSFNTWDVSGVSRGTDTATTNMNVSINNWTTNNVANFRLSDSTAATTENWSTSLWTWTSFSYTQIGDLFGVGSGSNHIVRANIPDADNDRASDSTWSNRTFGSVRVDDDDNTMPDSVGGVIDMGFFVGSVSQSVVTGTGTARTFQVTDGQFANLTGAPMEMHFKPRDSGSGINRDTGNAATSMNVSVQYFATNDVAHYSASRSASLLATKVASGGPTSVWAWTTSFSYDQIGNYFGSGGWTSPIVLNVPDADCDRPNDQRWRSNEQYGVLWYVDDDTNGPTYGTAVSNRPLGVIAGGLAVTGTTATIDAVYGVSDGALGAAMDGTNKLLNEGFDAGIAPWSFYTGSGGAAGIEWWAAEGSSSGAYFGAWNGSSPYSGGLFQDVGGIIAGQTYKFKIRARDETNFFGTVGLKIEYYNTSAVQIGGTTNNIIPDNTNWMTYYTQCTAPAGVSTARVVVTFMNTTTDVGSSKSFQMDNFVFCQITNPLTLVFNAYDATSGLWRTDSQNPNEHMHVSIGTNNASLSTLQTNVANFLWSDSTPDLSSTASTSTNVWKWAGLTGTEIQGLIDAGSNEVRATMIDADNDRTNDRLTTVNQRFGWIKVTDDDSAAPLTSNLVVIVGDHVAASSGSTTDITYRVSDGDLTNAASYPIRLSFNVYDTPAGVARDTINASTNMNVTVEKLATNNVDRFSPPPVSSSDTTINSSTSLWSWTTTIVYSDVTNLYGATGDSHYVRATIPDTDSDRAGDTMWTSNRQFGYIWVPDDDTNPPLFGAIQPGNVLYNPSFEQMGSWTGSAWHWQINYPDSHGGVEGNYLRASTNTFWHSHSGDWAAAIPGTWGANTNGYGGWWQEVTNSTAAGCVWQASAWFWSDNSGPKVWTAGWAGVQIEFRDSGGSLISSNSIGYAPAAFGEAWTNISVIATAPANCCWARIWISSWNMATQGALQIDDVVMRPATNLTMDVQIGNQSFYSSGSSSNALFWMTDGDLATVSPTNLLKFVFATYDPSSGVYRSTLATQTGVNFDVSNILTNEYTNYNASLSSPDTGTVAVSSTSVFTYVKNFSIGGPNPSITGQVWQMILNGTNQVTVSSPDDDKDRLSADNTWVYDQSLGRIRVTDDDTNGPWAWIAYVGTGYVAGASFSTNITDGDMTNGLDFAFGLWDTSGLFLTNNVAAGTNATDGSQGNINPNYEFVNPAGTQLNSDAIPTNIYSPAGNGSISATAVVMNTPFVNYNANTLGIWRVQISAQDYDYDLGYNLLTNLNGTVNTVSWDRSISANQWLQFNVTDDNSTPPRLRSWGGGGNTNANLQLFLGGDPQLGFSGSNLWWNQGLTYVTNADAVFRVTDGNLANVTNASPLDFRFWAYDTGDGLARSTSGSSSNTSLSIGSVVISNTASFVASNSAPVSLTKIGLDCSNYWRFTSFSRTDIGSLYGAAGHSNAIVLRAFNNDCDRPSDQEDAYTNLGWLVVNDDDTNKPVVGSALNNQLLNPSFETMADAATDAYAWIWGYPSSNCGRWGAAERQSWRYMNGGWEMAFHADMGLNDAGVWQQVTNAWPAGTAWEAQAWFWNDWGSGGYFWTSAVNQLVIEWYDYTGTNKLGGNTNLFTKPNETWTLYTVGATSPAGCCWVRFVACAWGMGSSTGALQMDDVVLRPVLSTATNILTVRVNDRVIPASAGTSNALFDLTDGDLGGITTANPFLLYFSAYDPESGLSRGKDDATYQMNVSVKNLTTNDLWNYSPSNSTPSNATTLAGAYSVWRWTGIDPNNIQGMIDAGSNEVTAILFDQDDDRNGDRMTNLNQRFGFLRVTDDDTNAPTAHDLRINNGRPDPATNYVTDQQIHIGQYPIELQIVDASGIATNWSEGWPPNFSVVNNAGYTGVVERGWDYVTSSDATNFLGWRNWAGAMNYTNVDLGTYKILWSARDRDTDRTGDWMAWTNSANIANVSNQFTVVDDDTTAPTPPTNVVVVPSGWTNKNSFLITFSAAQDASGIGQYRSSTNASPPSQASDGNLLPSNTVTSRWAAAISNGSFDIGYNTLLVPNYPSYTNGWLYLGSEGATCSFSTAEAQSSTLSLQHVLSPGLLTSGGGRYTLCSQYVSINNTNSLPIYLWYSGWFKGDMAKWQYGKTNVAFLKAECLDSNGQIVLAVENEYGSDHNGHPLSGINATNWTNVVITITNGPANTKTILFSCGLDSMGSELPCTGYFDNLTATVMTFDISAGGVFETNAPQGSNTVWLFAVDDDDDRPSDRMKSVNTNYTIYLDTTPPTQVVNLVVADGPDNTSEVALNWNKLDNGGGLGANPLSPWYTYRIFYTDQARAANTNDPYISVANGYTSLGTNITTNTVVSNFVFDTTYRLAVAGSDRAGNLGTISTSAIITLQGFYLTQGLANAVSGSNALFWTAATNAVGDITREYDLIYCDAMDFSEALTNAWILLSNGLARTLCDTGSTSRTAPSLMVDTMRFYRAAQHDYWTTNRSPRVASTEVYASKAIRLWRGQNWVGLPFIPDSNCVLRIFGTGLPGAGAAGNATKITWYAQTNSQTPSRQYWLAKTAVETNWYWGATNVNSWSIQPEYGFVIEIPTNASEPQVLVFLGRIPTNSLSISIQPNRAFNLVNIRWPRRYHPSQMNLISSGFQGGTYSMGSDRIRRFNRNGQQAGVDVWYRTSDSSWRLASSGNPVCPTNYFQPDDAIVIWTVKSSSSWVWTPPIPYSLPTRNMTP